MSIPKLTIDLKLPPSERWRFLCSDAARSRDMMRAYVTDLGGVDEFGPILSEYASSHVEADYLREMEGIASAIDTDLSEVLLGNLYYDAMSFMLGCTAFAIDTPLGPMHGRNLDWWSPGTALSSQTSVCHFVHGEEPRFQTIGWPGFIDCLSGIAPGRFSVTLNAVLSDEPSQLAVPITLLLRRVLEEAATYGEAVNILRSTPVASSSLLLVCGTRPGEMCVIERTPSRAEIRTPEDGFVVVTNDYRRIVPGKAPVEVNELQKTSCGRFDRAVALLKEQRPSAADPAFRVLRDEGIKMAITAQHMVFRPSDGFFEVRRPE